jgi:hypothetical protein
MSPAAWLVANPSRWVKEHTPVCGNDRSWQSAVYEQADSVAVAIRVASGISNGKVVLISVR